MMNLLREYLRNLLGGGSSYLIILCGFVIVTQYWKIANLQAETEKLETIRDEAIADIKERDTLIISQNRQFTRRQKTQEAQIHAEDAIQSVPDSENCRESLPVGSALNWMREHKPDSPKASDD